VSNERLRAAIARAGLDNEQLAELVGVDAKTVERWIAGGRLPYTRHRVRVAKALGADPYDLWPQADPAPRLAGQSQQTEPDTETEVVAAYPTGEAAGVPDWQILLTGARERVDLLDTTLLDVVSVPGVIDLLAAKAAAGCEIRILIANALGEWNLRIDAAWTPDGDRPSEVLIEDIDRARELLAPLLGQRGIEIREYVEADPGSILRFDEEILYSPNLWMTERTRAPLLHVTRRQPGGLFDRLIGQFEAIWTHLSEPVEQTWTEQRAEREELGANAPAQPTVHEDPTGSLLSAQEQEQLTTTLTRWGADPDTIADTLSDAAFVPGLAGIQSADPEIGPGVAIMIDEQRDPQIASLFRTRAERDDQAFVADWKVDRTHTRVLPAPNAPEALIAYTIIISKPTPLTRTYLILASKGGQPLQWLAQPGTNVWLIPHQLAIQESAKEGARTSHDMYDHMLPLGETLEPSLAIEAALTHIRGRGN
jgi:transcriptional regulator with XRE-family HTH domain